MIGTLYVTCSYQWSGPYMQHEVTNGWDPICNMKLPMIETLYVTRDPISNGRLPILLLKSVTSNDCKL